MIRRPWQGHTPSLHPTVRAAENAAVIGDVTCEAGVSLWYSATLRGDFAPITVGEGTNVQDGAVVHCDSDLPTTIGAGCVIGHNAIVHSATVGEGCMIGMGAILLSGCVIGAHSIVGAGALVTGKTVVPPYSMVLGSPAKVVKTVTSEQVESIRRNAEHYRAAAEQTLEGND